MTTVVVGLGLNVLVEIEVVVVEDVCCTVLKEERHKGELEVAW